MQDGRRVTDGNHAEIAAGSQGAWLRAACVPAPESGPGRAMSGGLGQWQDFGRQRMGRA